MISFESDYNSGAHPAVLKRLVETNDVRTLTYGFDSFSESAREKIRAACGMPDADIFFLSGGTQTNATVIDGVLQSYQGVISPATGHINVHEAAAIEASGHRVIALPACEGKITAADLNGFMNDFINDENHDHTAQPGMVYITFPTEFGTVYSSNEIADIYEVCKKHELPLFIDGARMGYGLMSDECDFDMAWLARHCDVMYIGGTKIGALCGEAVVFTGKKAPKHFFSIIKRHGALMAKGRLIGVQFDALFTDNLYFDISRNAITKAKRLKGILKAKGYTFYLESPTNQQFVILDDNEMKRISEKVLFSRWEHYRDNLTVCRFVTSWATTDKDLDDLEKVL